jgi:hypothetical protein
MPERKYSVLRVLRAYRLLRQLALCACALGMICSCNPAQTEVEPEQKRVFEGYHYTLDSLILSDKGIIAGVELGDSRALLPAHQVANAADQDKEGLVYEQAIDSITKFTITYTFENDTISEIEALVTCASHETGERILNDLKNYYRARYTAPIMDKGYYVFSCFDSRKRNFKITLTDNGGNANSLIDILIYREK